MKKFLNEQNAQAGAVFRLMVDAIIGLVIMGSILSLLNYFEQQKVAVSLQEFEQVVISAVNSPDGKIIESKQLTFFKGTTYNVINFSAITGHDPECFLIQGLMGGAKITDTSIEFLQNSQVRVFARCLPDQFHSDCPFYCTISFGKKII